MSCTLYSTVCLLIDHFEGTIEMIFIKTFFLSAKMFSIARSTFVERKIVVIDFGDGWKTVLLAIGNSVLIKNFRSEFPVLYEKKTQYSISIYSFTYPYLFFYLVEDVNPRGWTWAYPPEPREDFVGRCILIHIIDTYMLEERSTWLNGRELDLGSKHSPESLWRIQRGFRGSFEPLPPFLNIL